MPSPFPYHPAFHHFLYFSELMFLCSLEPKEDIAPHKRNGPAEVPRNPSYLLGFLPPYSQRHAHWFTLATKCLLLPELSPQLAKFRTGIEIHPVLLSAKVCLSTTVWALLSAKPLLWRQLPTYRGVTLGGTGKDKGKRHPTLWKQCPRWYSVLKFLVFRVGNNVKIAANAVVLNEIPDDCTAVGVPARIVDAKAKKFNNCPSGPLTRSICLTRFHLNFFACGSKSNVSKNVSLLSKMQAMLRKINNFYKEV